MRFLLTLTYFGAFVATSTLNAQTASTGTGASVTSGRTQEVAAPLQIIPPFGLGWGENDSKIERLVINAKAKVEKKWKVGDREIFEVKGLIQYGLQNVLFVFKNNDLTAVDLYYGNPAWGLPRYDDVFWQMERRIGAKFGVGVLIPAYAGDKIDTGSVLWGYKWSLQKTSIEEMKSWHSDAGGFHQTIIVRYECPIL